MEIRYRPCTVNFDDSYEISMAAFIIIYYWSDAVSKFGVYRRSVDPVSRHTSTTLGRLTSVKAWATIGRSQYFVRLTLLFAILNKLCATSDLCSKFFLRKGPTKDGDEYEPMNMRLL